MLWLVGSEILAAHCLLSGCCTAFCMSIIPLIIGSARHHTHDCKSVGQGRSSGERTCEIMVDVVCLTGICLCALDMAILSCRGSEGGPDGQVYDADCHIEAPR